MRLIFGHYKVESIRFPESVFVFKFPTSRDHHDFSLLAEKNGRGSRGSRSVLREMSECYYW